MDRIDAMKVFVSAVDEGSLAGAGRTPRQIAGGGEPRHRLPRSACRRRTASPHHPLAQAERGRRALCRRLPPRPGRSRGGRHRCGRRSLGAARHADADRTGHHRRGLVRPILDAFMDEHPTVTVQPVSARPAGQSDRRRHRRRAAHRASGRLEFVAIRLGEVRRVIAASPTYLARTSGDHANRPISPSTRSSR